MSLEIDLEECLGCGACESACPTGAVTQSTGFPVSYLVDPVLCNDCGRCTAVCPVEGLVVDPAWAVCHGRGCPLTSHRYEGWECSEGADPCPACGGVRWREPGGAWTCTTCDEGTGRAGCPKVRKSRRLHGQPA